MLAEDFPVPYLAWSEVVDSFMRFDWLELGYATAPEEPPLGMLFTPGERFAGRLKALVDALGEKCVQGNQVSIVSRQTNRLRELWLERTSSREADCSPLFIEGTLSEGWNLQINEQQFAYLLTDSEVFGWERPRPRPASPATAGNT